MYISVYICRHIICIDAYLQMVCTDTQIDCEKMRVTMQDQFVFMIDTTRGQLKGEYPRIRHLQFCSLLGFAGDASV